MIIHIFYDVLYLKTSALSSQVLIATFDARDTFANGNTVYLKLHLRCNFYRLERKKNEEL